MLAPRPNPELGAMNMTARLLWLALTGAATSAAHGQDASSSRFIGVWRLVETDQRLADGTRRPSPAYGARPQGYLIYSDAKRMCAMLMDPDRPRWKSDSAPTEVELRGSFERFFSYCGTYEVNTAEGFVIHRVELDKSPNAVGVIRKRFFKFSGNRLELTVASPLPAGVVEYRLVWERVTE